MKELFLLQVTKLSERRDGVWLLTYLSSIPCSVTVASVSMAGPLLSEVLVHDQFLCRWLIHVCSARQRALTNTPPTYGPT